MCKEFQCPIAFSGVMDTCEKGAKVAARKIQFNNPFKNWNSFLDCVDLPLDFVQLVGHE